MPQTSPRTRGEIQPAENGSASPGLIPAEAGSTRPEVSKTRPAAHGATKGRRDKRRTDHPPDGKRRCRRRQGAALLDVRTRATNQVDRKPSGSLAPARHEPRAARKDGVSEVAESGRTAAQRLRSMTAIRLLSLRVPAMLAA